MTVGAPFLMRISDWPFKDAFLIASEKVTYSVSMSAPPARSTTCAEAMIGPMLSATGNWNFRTIPPSVRKEKPLPCPPEEKLVVVLPNGEANFTNSRLPLGCMAPWPVLTV